MPETALIAGVGDGLGAALGRRFARAGYTTFLLARTPEKLTRIAHDIRSAGGQAVALACDARDPLAVANAFERCEQEHGPLAVAVFNAAAFHREPVVATSAQTFEQIWRVACYAGFIFGQQAALRMTPRGKGTILFTGASASLRGSAQFSAFAAAKAGLRALAQSMARELGPQGLHVAHVIIDGIIDSERARTQFASLAQSPDALLQPDAIAEAYFQLHAQPRSAWTQELDVRPWSEKF